MAPVVANIALTHVTRSFEHSLFNPLRYPNALLRGILAGTVVMLLALVNAALPRLLPPGLAGPSGCWHWPAAWSWRACCGTRGVTG